MAGVEPALPAWKAGVLAVIRHVHKKPAYWARFVRRGFLPKMLIPRSAKDWGVSRFSPICFNAKALRIRPRTGFLFHRLSLMQDQRHIISGFTAASLALWLCTVMGNRCMQQFLEPYPLWFVRSAFKRLRILPHPYQRAAYYHSFFNSLCGKDICVPTTQGLQAAKATGLVRIVERRSGVASPFVRALGFGIGAARGSRSHAHATDTWRSSAPMRIANRGQQLCSI